MSWRTELERKRKIKKERDRKGVYCLRCETIRPSSLLGDVVKERDRGRERERERESKSQPKGRKMEKVYIQYNTRIKGKKTFFTRNIYV
jgi:uncharacterized protein YifE (UPF0438 family)